MKRISIAILLLFFCSLAWASVTVNINGTPYTIPQSGERGWGTQVTTWIQAASQHLLQKTGGAFTLTADTDFGASFGLKSVYYKSRTLNPATTGEMRLGNTEGIYWRNAANSANLGLVVNSSNQLTFNGNALFSSTALTADRPVITTTGGLLTTEATLAPVRGGTGQDFSAATGLVKVAAGTMSAATLVNADVSGSAAIAYSKLNLGSSIVDADVSGSAAIARSKVASGTADHVVINSGAGVLASEAQLAISRGGTGAATQTNAMDALAPTTTKGDVIVHNGSDNVRLAVGSDTQILTANSAATNGVEWATAPAANDPQQLNNFGLAASISANQLVVALKQADGSTDPSTVTAAVKVAFRGATATNGNYDIQSFTGASSITLSTTDSMGVPSALSVPVYVYAIKDTTSELCLSNSILDEGTLQSATALTGGAEVTAGTLYCTNAHTSKPIKLVGRVKATFSNPNWGTIAEVSVSPFAVNQPRSVVIVEAGNGHGSTNNKVRRWTNIRSNNGGADIDYSDSAANGGSFIVKTAGVYCMQYSDYRSGGGNEGYGIVVNGSAGTTSITTLTYAEGKRAWNASVAMGTDPTSVSWCGPLAANDYVWAQTGGVADCSNTACMFTISKVSN